MMIKRMVGKVVIRRSPEAPEMLFGKHLPCRQRFGRGPWVSAESSMSHLLDGENRLIRR